LPGSFSATNKETKIMVSTMKNQPVTDEPTYEWKGPRDYQGLYRNDLTAGFVIRRFGRKYWKYHAEVGPKKLGKFDKAADARVAVEAAVRAKYGEPAVKERAKDSVILDDSNIFYPNIYFPQVWKHVRKWGDKYISTHDYRLMKAGDRDDPKDKWSLWWGDNKYLGDFPTLAAVRVEHGGPPNRAAISPSR
jgi:hypothetical protein